MDQFEYSLFTNLLIKLINLLNFKVRLVIRQKYLSGKEEELNYFEAKFFQVNYSYKVHRRKFVSNHFK